ncbi:hypothetical protein EDEG_00741 [Edhazardia aedis USNM 41457]|uniref:Uncharacterized protein n=1 Tax=Edhazardia aedis (strain USNM 41457) TaxID=1003232 RepID=J9DRG8_EDHAE|nr:hypothetical protein EDEG_00741 [Edhazardia aedis USNM 41457]|eukprot:EJW05160.1 hypothetical protein EDEG_00741 [Edhazardia aedis USNM 41457]
MENMQCGRLCCILIDYHNSIFLFTCVRKLGPGHSCCLLSEIYMGSLSFNNLNFTIGSMVNIFFIVYEVVKISAKVAVLGKHLRNVLFYRCSLLQKIHYFPIINA